MGKAMFTIIAAMAELERSIIRERVVAGLDHALRNGTRSGKPVGRPRAIFDHQKVVELRQQGQSWRQIARPLGVYRQKRVQDRQLAEPRSVNSILGAPNETLFTTKNRELGENLTARREVPSHSNREDSTA
jgi:hypothetical protein